MISKRVQDALNEQIKHEFSSAYVYLAMSAHFDTQNLNGFASWLRVQAQEEVAHAMKIFDFLQDRGGTVHLHGIDQPKVDYATTIAVFEAALAHEQKISRMINSLYEIALAEKDYPTQVMLMWFIEEQVEEEKTVSDIVEQLRMVGSDKVALLVLDKEFAGRSEPAA